MSRKNRSYDASFYAQQSARSRSSASEVLPIVVEYFKPSSVIDVGCGVGTWASVCQELGVREVVGLDGAYVDPSLLQISADDFQAKDLETLSASDAERRFDLALSVEVAEHLSHEAAPRFVSFLCASAPVVVFGAAIPGQGGLKHINEQPQSYWAAHFAANGYFPLDLIRARVWSHPDVEYWYAQNTLVYVNDPKLAASPPPILDIVHPQALADKMRMLRKKRSRWF